MRNDKDSYISGIPIDTELGRVAFLKYHEYINHQFELRLISMNVLHIYYFYKERFKEETDPETLETIEAIKDQKLISIVLSENSFFEAYVKVFKKVLLDNEDDQIIRKIFEDEDMFLGLRNLILDMNAIVEEEVSPNPEIQEFIEADREQKAIESGKVTLNDIMSSIVAWTGFTYNELIEMTVFQVKATYRRIAQLKSYDTSTLFATVAENVKIEHWGGHIDLFEIETSGTKMSEFNKKFGNLFN